MVFSTGNFLLLGSVLLFVSVFASKAGFRFGIPALVLFLVVGMLFGNDGVGIQFHSPPAAQFIGILALSIILFSGGMDTKFSEVRPVLGPGITLATLGVALMTLITGGFIYAISSFFNGFINLSLTESMLLAAIMSSTDSASVFSILRSKKTDLKYNLRPLLELESGSNDPMAYMLTIILTEVITWGGVSWGTAVGMFLMQMSIGAVAGYLLGHLAVWVTNKINLDNRSLYSVLLLAWVFFIFSITDIARGNGYLAVYIAGLIVGNKKMVYKRNMSTFFDGFTWLFQIVMFLSLGLLVNPSELLQVAWIGVLLAIVMIFIARPATVFVCLAPFKNFSLKAKTYVSWVGLRGAVPIIFATYPLIADVANAKMFFNIVFCITLISLIVQGTTVGSFARLLGISQEPKEVSFDIYLPEKIKAALSEIRVVQELISKGNRLMDIDLPSNTIVVMVKQEERYFVPEADTILHPGDRLLVISDNDEELRKTYFDMGIVNPLGHR